MLVHGMRENFYKHPCATFTQNSTASSHNTQTKWHLQNISPKGWALDIHCISMRAADKKISFYIKSITENKYISCHLFGL